MTMPPTRDPEAFEAMLRSVLRGQADVQAPMRLRDAAVQAVSRPARTSTRWSILDASARPLVSVTRFLVAGVLVTVFGGSVLVGSLARPAEPHSAGAGQTSTALDATPSARGGFGTPPPCPAKWEPPDPGILWETRSARLEADAIEMRLGDCHFTGVGPIIEVDSDPGDQGYRTLEVDYQEQGDATRFYVYFGADETHWWVREMCTPVGCFGDDPAIRGWEGQLFRTPRGETFEGDVHLEGAGDPERGIAPPAQLKITGLRLIAFAPGTGPAPLTGCRHVPQQDRKATRRRLIESGVLTMTPTQAERRLRERGLCFTFRYDYPFPDGEGLGYSERWCSAPPGKTVADVGFLPDGELVVFVGDKRVRPQRTQPPEGWNCPTDAAAASDPPSGA
jgi:hypothetical protein